LLGSLDPTGTAVAADFSPAPAASGTFAWADGEGTAKSVTFSVAGDTAVEPDESIIVTLSAPVGCTIGAASATLTIRDDDVTTPPPEDADEPENPQTGLTTVTATPANFAARYGALTPGQRLLLANGNYGSVTLNRTNPDAATRPFVIEAENLGGAVFGTITLGSQGHWLHRLRLDGDQGVFLNADRQWITKCWFRGTDGIRTPSTVTNRGFVKIGWCRFTGPSAAAGVQCDHIKFEQPGEGNWTTNTSGPHDIRIYRSFFWGASNTQESHSIYFGDTKAGAGDIPMMHEVHIRWNFWHVGMGRNRGLYIKRGCVVEWNHIA
jgi:hypothetical protein